MLFAKRTETAGRSSSAALVTGAGLVMWMAALACSEDPSASGISVVGSSVPAGAGTNIGSVEPEPEEIAAGSGGDDREAINPGSVDLEAAEPSPSVDARSDAGPPPAVPDAGTGAAPEVGDTLLFNGQNLDGWTAARGDGAGQTIEQIFQVTDGMIHVYKGAVQGSTQPIATLRTNESYSSYVLHLEYMWGTTRFSDRSNTDRDAGILFHVFNNLNAVWPDSFEFQMGSSALGGEWVSGDIFVLGGSTRGQTSSVSSGGNQVFAELANGGMRRSITNGARARANVKLDMAGWNTIELTVRADTEAEYKLNGVAINRVYDMEGNAGGGFQPLARGPIALQAEYAELFYRNIRLRELP